MRDGEELFAGRTLGRYQLLAPIAQGATASVWAARTTGSHLEKIVALKAMLAELGPDIDAESMFLDEARLARASATPTSCAVLDLGEEDGRALHRHGVGRRRARSQVVMRHGARGDCPTRARGAHREAGGARPARRARALRRRRPAAGHRAPRRVAAEHPRRLRRAP